MKYCMREKLEIPRGERYEMCRSVHAEQNAIISASRKEMIGGIIYLVGLEVKTGEYVSNAMPCAMCKRAIINAGLVKLVVRNSADEFIEVDIQDFIDNDETLEGVVGY